MKHTLYKLVFAAALLIGIAACKKNNEVVDQDPFILPETARFTLNPALKANPYYGYFITQTPTPGSQFKIPVGVTTVSSSPRKVRFTFTSRTAVAGAQYTAASEITIPAGKAEDTLTVQGLFAGFPPGRRDTLKIKITGGDGFVSPQSFNDSLFLVMQRYCDVNFPTFAGNYDNTNEYAASGAVSWGPYTTAVRNIAYTAGTTTATAVIDNIYDYGGSVNATFNWTDKAKFTVTIPEQNTGVLVSSGGVNYQLWLRTNGSTSTFSSCENTITLFIDAIAKVPATGATAGNFSTNLRIVLAR